MPDLADGEMFEMKGSGAKPYQLKNVGGVYSCSCPAWRNQSTPIERRTCKHLRKLRGDAEEEARIGSALPQKPVTKSEDATEATAPGVLLAESWDNAVDLSGWWMSEKLDGVRAYWDGTQFLSRQGNLYHAPDWFVEGLPSSPLDGELWIGRKAFQRTTGIVRRQDKTDLWKEVKYLIFDSPAAGGPFEDRVKSLQEAMPRWKARYAFLHPHELCRGVDHLRNELQRIEGLGGEGLMLREPGSKYEAGRSSTLLKVKSFRDDEAVVIGHEPGKGKHSGRLGALTVRLASGKVFSVGTGFTDRERQNPPPIGSLISFRYQELTDAEIPRFPSYLGLRTDGATIASPPTPKAATAKSPPRQSTTVVSSDTASKRHFELTEDGSSKFWEIWHEGAELTTRWGKIGTNGQQKTKAFASAEKAQAEVAKLIAEKTAKGYIESEG